ncbi:hypothetical protein RJT34_08126 [Clitoria ternatea]|uniref:Cytoplasmic tRNA 2-thiolation protein 1 n=1 Tax=Clitoria ternatea TaxID=43366 RepID=A0AAN9K5A8_CLITE
MNERMEEGKRVGRLCCLCNQRRASLKRPKTLQNICRECFYTVFEDEIHQVIINNKLFTPGERIAIGASGGKDSTVLAYVLSKLNRLHNYGLHLFLLSVDEGITGYRDDSLETVHRNQIQYGLPLQIVSYKDLYGWTMDDIVNLIGFKNNCTFCGVFRRQALDRGATLLKADKLVTGHNADDIAETVLLNLLRGDIARLSRCTSITTGEDDGFVLHFSLFQSLTPSLTYAYFKKLDYFSTECIYSPNAYRGFAREFIKDLERMRPKAILDIIKSGENFRISNSTKMPEQGTCQRCGYISSQKWCKACVLLDGLNRGLPKLGIGRSRASVGSKKTIESKQFKDEEACELLLLFVARNVSLAASEHHIRSGSGSVSVIVYGDQDKLALMTYHPDLAGLVTLYILVSLRFWRACCLSVLARLLTKWNEIDDLINGQEAFTRFRKKNHVLESFSSKLSFVKNG